MNRICPSCGHKDEVAELLWPADWHCQICDFRLSQASGFPLLCPELADTVSGFDPDSFSKLVEVEKGHFWFQSRNNLISWLVKKYISDAGNFLEVGCGTGFVLSRLASDYNSIKFSACEIHPSGMKFAKERLGENVDFFQADARKLGLENCLDAIGSFDVVEHIQEDELVLVNFYDALRVGGGIILSVPQHPFLWSEADEMAHHKRRYKRGELEGKLQKAGFNVVFSSSFTSLLLLPMLVSRMLAKTGKTVFGGKEENDMNEFDLPGPLNSVFRMVNNFELKLIKLGIRLPVGGSRVVVAKK